MKPIYMLFSVWLLFSTIRVNAQTSTAPLPRYRYELGLEGGFVYPRFQLNDPGGLLLKNPPPHRLPTGLGAVAFHIHTPKQWVYKISAGFYALDYDYELKDVYKSDDAPDEEVLFAMGNIGYALPVGHRLQLIPMLGVAANVSVMENGFRVGYEDTANNPFSIRSTDAAGKFFVTANAALELKYQMARRFQFGLSGNYMQGFANRATHQVSYRNAAGAPQQATMTSKGSFLYLMVAMRYCF